MDEDRLLLGALVGILLVLTALLVLPYLQFVLGAILLAYVLAPLQARLSERIGPSASAAVLVTGSVVLVVLPFLVIIAVVSGEVLSLVEGLEDLEFATLEEPIEGLTGQDVDLESAAAGSLEQAGQAMIGGAFAAVEVVTGVLVGLGLAVFLLFFLVRDGHRFVAWLKRVSPLADPVTETLLERVDRISRAVLAGHVLVAIIQGVIAGIGLAVTGVPNATFWTIVMVILALIPLIGTFAVWAPAAVWLVWTGDVIFGAGLFVYGLVVVGISDEYLRPVIVDRYAEINPGVIILGVIGGLSAFGVMGLFVGPIVIGVCKEAIEVYDTHYG